MIKTKKLIREEKQRIIDLCKNIPPEEWGGKLNKLKYSSDLGINFYFYDHINIHLSSEFGSQTEHCRTLVVYNKYNHCKLEGEDIKEAYQTIFQKVSEYRKNIFHSSLDRLLEKAQNKQ